MASEGAKMVAKKVAENIRKGKKPHLGKIIKEVGYAEATSRSPQRVTKTKSYQDEVADVVKAMVKQRDRMIAEIGKRKLDKEKVRDMVDAIDKLTKNAQLLGGKDTSKEAVTFSWEE